MDGFPNSLTQRSMARILGKSPSNLTYWADKFSMPKNPDGSFSAPDVIRWLTEREYKKGIAAQEKLATSTNLEFDAGSDWDKRYKKARSLREELRYEVDLGRVANVDQVKTSWTRVLSMLRSTLQAIPKTLAATLSGMSREEVFEALDKSIRDAVDHFIDAYEQ